MENWHTLYHGKDFMKKFSESLWKHAKNITDFEKKKMLPLTKEEINHIKLQEIFTFVEEESWKNFLKV